MVSGRTRTYQGIYPTTPLTNDTWMAHGACADPQLCSDDPELFFDLDRQAQAAQFCRTHCPVMAECAAFAAQHGVKDGVWGGRSFTSRRRQQ